MNLVNYIAGAFLIMLGVIVMVAAFVAILDFTASDPAPTLPGTVDSLPGEVDTVQVGVTEERVHEMIHQHQQKIFECQDFVIIGGANGQGASWRCR